MGGKRVSPVVNLRNGEEGRETEIPGGLQPNFRPGSNAVSTNPPPRTDRLIRFLRLRHGITVLSAKLFWIHVSPMQTGSSNRPVDRLIFLCESTFFVTFLRERRSKRLDSIGLSRVIQ